jgi:hypothetical protein
MSFKNNAEAGSLTVALQRMSWHPATAALLRGLCAKAAVRPKQRSHSYG